MTTDEALARIAAALERLAPPATAAPTTDASDWTACPAYRVTGADGVRAVPVLTAPPLDLLRGIDRQKAEVVANVARHAAGHAAHDMLLWGARGMGKSALLRAAVCAVQADSDTGANAIALVQLGTEALPRLSALFERLGAVSRPFMIFIDDLGFAPGDTAGPRALRSALEGGVAPRPGNVRLAVTANARAVVPRTMAEQDDPINRRDAVDDALALADRFGLSLGFHVASQEAYLAIVAGYAAHHGLEHEPADALEWARRRGARSGRTAWQYVTELAGRAGRNLEPAADGQIARRHGGDGPAQPSNG